MGIGSDSVGPSVWGSVGGTASFSFSDVDVVWTSVLSSATAASVAHTAGVGGGTGVSLITLLYGHTAAHRAIQAEITVAMMNFFIFLPPSEMRNERPISWPFGKRLNARFRSYSVPWRVSMPAQIQR